jgi:hypothetical protein
MTSESKPLPSDIRTKIEQYRAELLSFDMCEPIKRTPSSHRCFFYKPMTELTAFIVNLQGNEFNIEITYGYASTAYTRMAGDENALVEWGVSNEDITLREKVIIRGDADEASAKRKIAEMYHSYRQIQKDDLVLLAKEKRKAFIQQIHAKLKPLGFKKKANTWTFSLTDTYYLMFNVQKSGFSDEYYFNVYIGINGTNDYGDCYYTRIAPPGMIPMDWQALDKEEFSFFLDKSVVPELKKIIGTPLTELGQIASYWAGCQCNRQKCENCWMQKIHRGDLYARSYYRRYSWFKI